MRTLLARVMMMPEVSQLSSPEWRMVTELREPGLEMMSDFRERDRLFSRSRPKAKFKKSPVKSHVTVTNKIQSTHFTREKLPTLNEIPLALAVTVLVLPSG